MSLKNICFLFFLLLSSAAQALHLVESCQIFGASGEVLLSLPGDRCIFFPDGRLVGSNSKVMRLVNTKRKVAWTLRTHLHHQLNLSVDQQSLLTLGSETINVDGKKIRSDVLLKISMDGEIIARLSAQEILKQTKLEGLRLEPSAVIREETNSDLELSHFNSFYEIPDLDPKAIVPSYIKRGNFIAGGLQLGIFILSSDLKTVLHHIQPPSSAHSALHDAQITYQGKVLIFNNIENNPGSPFNNSAIQELDPDSGKVLFSFTAEPKALFYSQFCGGAQRLSDDLILFSHLNNGTFIYNQKTKKIIYSTLKTHMYNGTFRTVQQVKAVEVSDFLKAWGVEPMDSLNL